MDHPMTDTNQHHQTGINRRTFVQNTSASIAAASLAAPLIARTTRRRDTLNIGVIGCGGRGTGAAVNAVEASEDARVVALADVFTDRVESSRGHLATVGDRCRVSEAHCYVGFDAYKQLLRDADVDVVILATPPQFRPMHFDAAINAGKHVFMEKPVAVDPAGIRTVIDAAKRARSQRLSVVAGTQRRHEASYREAIRRLHDGAIGRVVAARCYWNQGGLWKKDPQPEWTDMEWQLRNWLYFTWLSGDHLVEQHVHNLDVVNWVIGDHPVRALGLGGRQARTADVYGNIFDHHAIEYEYEDGTFLMSMCRQQDGCPSRVEEVIHGTEGRATLRPGYAVIEGRNPWTWSDRNPNPYVEEHRHLHDSIRGGTYLNEGQRIAESTLTAIMGRMATYTGQVVDWNRAMSSELDLSPSAYAFGSLDVRPVAIPGRTPLR